LKVEEEEDTRRSEREPQWNRMIIMTTVAVRRSIRYQQQLCVARQQGARIYGMSAPSLPSAAPPFSLGINKIILSWVLYYYYYTYI